MRKVLMLAVASLLLCSCGPSAAVLYYWGGNASKGVTRYEDRFYDAYGKSQSPESLCDMLCVYEDMLRNPGGERGVVPPGICAEYGYLLLKPETAAAFAESASKRERAIYERSDYATYFPEYGLKLLQKEMELYPESRKFIEPLLKKFAGK